MVMRPPLPCDVLGTVKRHAGVFYTRRHHPEPIRELKLAPLSRESKSSRTHTGQTRNQNFCLFLQKQGNSLFSCWRGVRIIANYNKIPKSDLKFPTLTSNRYNINRKLQYAFQIQMYSDIRILKLL